MRQEQEMWNLIINTAKADKRIRAVVLNGSRANPSAPKDMYQDFDIVYFVSEMDSFLSDHSWIDLFGERVILQMPKLMVLPPDPEDGSFTYLMQFMDGNRIDLTLMLIEQVMEYVDLDSQTVILLDKDNLIPKLPEPSDKDYWVKRPSVQEFENCCNEFNWVCPYVVKGLWRDEWPFALHMFNHHVWDMLDLMVTWHIGFNTDFKLSCGKYGKYYRHYLNEGLWRQLRSCYATQDEQGLWSALYNARTLFKDLGQEVANQLGIDYPEDEHQRVDQFIHRMEQQFWEKDLQGQGSPQDDDWSSQELKRMTDGLLKLDDVSFQRLLRECHDHQIMSILQALEEPDREFVYRNMSHRRQQYFMEELKVLPSAGDPSFLLGDLRELYNKLEALEQKGEVIVRGMV